MVILRSRDNLSNEMIASFQKHADLFFQGWISLWQNEGITNYIHMIGASHLADYLFKWKNLYRFSQQGWEAMNFMIKTYFLGELVMGEVSRWQEEIKAHSDCKVAPAADNIPLSSE